MSAQPNAAPKISVDSLTKFAQVTAKIAELEKTRKALREELIDALEAGASQPLDSPFLVELTYQERSTSSWKDVFTAVLMEFSEQSQRRMWNVANKLLANKDNVAVIKPRPNPAWRPNGESD